MQRNSATSQFLQTVAPLLDRPADSEILNLIKREWPADKLVGLLIWRSSEVVCTALRCLALTGTLEQVRYVAAMLHHADKEVAAAAEDALWRIWMQAGSPWAVRALSEAVSLVGRDQFDDAQELLDAIAMAEPSFAEAHHQRGLVAALRDEPGKAECGYRQALRLNPYHFAAAEGMGQLALDRGALREALGHYEHARHIHPRLAHVDALIIGLRQALGETAGHA